MRAVAVVFAVATMLLLAACGGSSAQTDPFVGTWRQVDAPASRKRLVVTQVQGGYQAFLIGGPVVVGPIPLQRDGDVLVFPAQNGVERQTFKFHGDSGRLTDKDGSAPGIDFELVSRSTSHPPPASPQSSPDQSF